MLTLLLGSYTATAQDLSVNGAYIQGMEHIGDDIKQGFGLTVNANFDLFSKSGFNFGPSFTYYELGEIKSDIEELSGDKELGAGLHMGFDAKKVAFDVKYELPLTPNRHDEPIFFESVLSGKIQFLPYKGKGVGFQTGVDYFFNKHIFHYTYQITGGLFYRFN